MDKSIFSKESRLAIYSRAHELYVKNWRNPSADNHFSLAGSQACLGLCSVMSSALYEQGYDSVYLTRENFPELFSYKPKTGWKQNRRFWWTISDRRGGTAKRMEILHRLSKGLSKGQTL